MNVPSEMHLPLVELHRHLDGSVRLSTVLDLGRKHGLDLPAWTEEELRPHVQIVGREASLVAFLEKFKVLQRAVADYDAVKRITRENLEDAAAEGIDYIELRFSPWFMAESHGLDPAGVASAVCDARDEALNGADPVPVKAKLIGILSRTYGREIAFEELDALLPLRDRGVVAIDLAGDEAGMPGHLFLEHFRRARDAGFETIAHAGEADGAESVRQAVEDLGAVRIGHGIRCLEDPAVVELLLERAVPLEVCPTSNVHTSTVGSYGEHPLPRFLELGLNANLNTDDPSISGIDLPHEYRVARDEMGLREEHLRTLRENALRAAFLSDEERRELIGAG
jgi:adenosine deaminase